MIIITGKQLKALKEEIKADLRREVARETADMVVLVFKSVFPVDGQYRDIFSMTPGMWSDWLGAGNKNEDTVRSILAKAACGVTSMLDHKIKSHYKDQVAEVVTEYVQGEEFVDEVISRINRKQLIGGKR